jgi:hypothetical protein
MTDSRTIFDPFLGKEVVIVDRLTDRLRGNYACGPHLPNGRPEFGFRQFQAPPIQHEAAAVIEALVKALEVLLDEATNFNVSGVYFDEDCMGHKGPALARAILDVVGSATGGQND